MDRNERDLILADLAEGRQAVDDFGLRRTRVFLRVRRWHLPSGATWAASTARGLGVPVDEERAILPTPRVRPLSTRYVVESGGRFQVGDIRVDRITPRDDPSTGVELHEFKTPNGAANEERHVMLMERSGTPWHLREGTPRLYAAAPTTEAACVAAVNGLRATIAAHLPDAEAHSTPDATAVPSTPATDTASAITLANALRAIWQAHRASLSAHPQADPYALSAGAATDAPTLLVLLHALLTAVNAHSADGPIRECETVEATGSKAFSHELVVRPTRRTPA